MLFRKGSKKERKIDRLEKTDCIKKERKRSLKNFLPCSPTNGGFLFGKVSFGISLAQISKAGVALETLLILPIFLLAMVTMISFMDIYRMETQHLSMLCDRAKAAGMYAYTADGDEAKEIALPDVYAYQPVGGIFPLPKVWMSNTVKVHTWTGTGESTFAATENAEKMVYVAESGSVFHRNPGCSYLNLSVDQVSGSKVQSMRNAYGENYTACETCSRNQKPAGSVYITKKSNRYHNLETCSGLKRTVRLVKEREAKGHACSRCG